MESNPEVKSIISQLEKIDNWQEESSLILKLHKLLQDLNGMSRSGPKSIVEYNGWSIRDTAKLLSRTTTSVFKSIKLGYGLRDFPNIGRCKNKKIALEILWELRSEAHKRNIS